MYDEETRRTKSIVDLNLSSLTKHPLFNVNIDVSMCVYMCVSKNRICLHGEFCPTWSQKVVLVGTRSKVLALVGLTSWHTGMIPVHLSNTMDFWTEIHPWHSIKQKRKRMSVKRNWHWPYPLLFSSCFAFQYECQYAMDSRGRVWN